MRSISLALQSHLAANPMLSLQVMVWLSPRNKTSGTITPMGFWTGDDHELITIDGESRQYFGAGGLIGLDEPMVYRNGLDVGSWNFTLSDQTPEFDALYRGCDLRMAPIEVHRGAYDPITRTLVEPPHRLLKGWVETAPLDEAKEGEESVCTINCVTSAMGLTKPLSLTKSDAFQQTKGGDRINRYAAVSGAVTVKWGV